MKEFGQGILIIVGGIIGAYIIATNSLINYISKTWHEAQIEVYKENGVLK